MWERENELAVRKTNLYCCEAVRLYGMTIREVVRGRELAGSEKWLIETAHSREYAPISPGVAYIRVAGEIKTGAHRS